MSAGGLIAALAGGTVLGLVILRRQDQSKSAQPSPAPSGSPCDSLPAGTARDFCKGASGVLGVVKGIGDLVLGDPHKKNEANAAAQKAVDENNRALNGDVDLPITFAASHCNGPGSADGPGDPINTWGSPLATFRPLIAGEATVLRYKNGCVPFKGASGSEKCAPGTKFQGEAPNIGTGFIDYAKLKGTGGSPSTYLLQDPISGYHIDRLVWSKTGTGHDYPNGGKCAGAFPIPIPPGHYGYYYRGQPFTCPVGTRVDFSVRDHRAKVTAPPCLKPGEKRQLATGDGGGAVIDAALERNAQGGTGTRTNVSDPATDPNFIFDPTIGAWRRKRAGE